MSVMVYFVDGTTKEYRGDCNSTNQDSVFTVGRWSKKKRKYESIDSFESSRIKLAEVRDRFGNIEEIILGSPNA